jgi:hypothetical protein
MSPAEPPASKSAAAPARPRRWRRRTIIAAGVLAILWLVHAPLLRNVGSFVAADRPLDKADYIVVLPSMAGDGAAIDEAVKRVHDGQATGLVLFRPPTTRSVQCGAWAEFETSAREALGRQGLSSRAIVFAAGESRTSWDAARAMAKWLDGRPDVRLDVLCQRFRGRYERSVFGSVLSAAAMGQLHFSAVWRDVDETNWWHDREAIQMVFQNYSRLLFIWLNSEPHAETGQWTLEQYERSLPTPAK